MRVSLQLVGFYQGKNVRIKGHQFMHGVCDIDCGAEYAKGITDYLAGWGAYPIHEAETRQAVLDASMGKHVTMKNADAKVQAAELILAKAKKEREEILKIKREAQAQKELERQEQLEIQAATQVLVKQKMAKSLKDAADLLAAQEESEQDDSVSDIASALSAGDGKKEDPKAFAGRKNKNSK